MAVKLPFSGLVLECFVPGPIRVGIYLSVFGHMGRINQWDHQRCRIGHCKVETFQEFWLDFPDPGLHMPNRMSSDNKSVRVWEWNENQNFIIVKYKEILTT